MKKGLSSNSLKVVAITIMIIDHIASYMYQDFDRNAYYILRGIRKNGNAYICIFDSARIFLY